MFPALLKDHHGDRRRTDLHKLPSLVREEVQCYCHISAVSPRPQTEGQQKQVPAEKSHVELLKVRALDHHPASPRPQNPRVFRPRCLLGHVRHWEGVDDRANAGVRQWEATR